MAPDIEIFHDTVCDLGEGPLWHPDRHALFWFDINNARLYARQSGLMLREWTFAQPVSAAARLRDDPRLLVAGAEGLMLFDTETGEAEPLCPLEAENPVTRSNDGRADPWGGFWIGTMGRKLEKGAGAIYRYYRGELRKLYDKITVSNAICFSPDRRWGYFTDTVTGVIQRVALNENDGWPEGEPAPFVEIANPDGAVVDASGDLWCAQYGRGQISRISPDGKLRQEIALEARQPTCPAFAGAGSGRLFVTSAAQGLKSPGPADGTTLVLQVDAAGQDEHAVIL